MTPTRPLEYVALFQMDIPTQQDGDVYVFIAVDSFSKFLFNTGIERELNDNIILKHISLLMENKDFKAHRENGFTLILHKYEHLIFAINQLIKPFNGSVIVNDEFVAKTIEEPIKEMYKSMSQ